MEKEILKKSFPAPEWFVKEKIKQLKVIQKLMEKEKIPEKLIKYIEKRGKLDDAEKRIAAEELMIEARKNPKLERLIDMSKHYNEYLWEKLRYENWDAFGVEDHLRYDSTVKMILVLQGAQTGSPEAMLRELFHKQYGNI